MYTIILHMEMFFKNVNFLFSPKIPKAETDTFMTRTRT